MPACIRGFRASGGILEAVTHASSRTVPTPPGGLRRYAMCLGLSIFGADRLGLWHRSQPKTWPLCPGGGYDWDMTTTRVTAINRGSGQIEIHAPGCKDLKRRARGASIWDIDAETWRDVVADVYPPDDFDYDLDTEWVNFSGDIVAMNCCPKIAAHDTPAAVATTATRTRRSHATCQHECTPRARAACRKSGGPKV